MEHRLDTFEDGTVSIIADNPSMRVEVVADDSKVVTSQEITKDRHDELIENQIIDIIS